MTPWGKEIALLQDLRDYQIMLWITKQARYRARHERQYGHGKPIKRLHPLARIGMSI
jgi:hypothetical protein